MKKLLIPMLFAGAAVALYEQSKPQPNPYVMIGALAVFLYGMMRLGSKIPSKKSDDEQPLP